MTSRQEGGFSLYIDSLSHTICAAMCTVMCAATNLLSFAHTMNRPDNETPAADKLSEMSLYTKCELSQSDASTTEKILKRYAYSLRVRKFPREEGWSYPQFLKKPTKAGNWLFGMPTGLLS